MILASWRGNSRFWGFFCFGNEELEAPKEKKKWQNKSRLVSVICITVKFGDETSLFADIMASSCFMSATFMYFFQIATYLDTLLQWLLFCLNVYFSQWDPPPLESIFNFPMLFSVIWGFILKCFCCSVPVDESWCPSSPSPPCWLRDPGFKVGRDVSSNFLCVDEPLQIQLRGS